MYVEYGVCTYNSVLWYIGIYFTYSVQYLCRYLRYVQARASGMTAEARQPSPSPARKSGFSHTSFAMCRHFRTKAPDTNYRMGR